MIEKEILYWMLALNMVQGMWILVLRCHGAGTVGVVCNGERRG